MVNRKLILTAAGVAATVLATGIGVALWSGPDADRNHLGMPPIGTYSTEPVVSWKFRTISDRAEVPMILDESLIVLDFDLESGSGQSAQISSLSKDSGGIKWDLASDHSDCGMGEYRARTHIEGHIAHSHDGRYIACATRAGYGKQDVKLYGVDDGSRFGHLDNFTSGSSILLSGSSAYICDVYDENVSLLFRDYLDSTKGWSISIPKHDVSDCRLSRESGMVIATGKDWSTVVDENGGIKHQSFDRGVYPLGDNLLFEHNPSGPGSVLTVDGEHLYDPDFPFTIIPVDAGQGEYSLFLDGDGTLRQPRSGEKLGTLRLPEERSAIGRFGDVAVFLEEGVRVRAYDIKSGAAVWAIGADELYPSESTGGKIPALHPFNDNTGTLTDGRYLLVASERELISLDTTTGNITWRISKPSDILARDNDMIIVRHEKSLTAYTFE